jgi:hypothetical protein
MINVTNVVTFLLDRVKQVYKHEKTNDTAEEKDVAYQLFLTLQSVLKLKNYSEEYIYILIYIYIFIYLYEYIYS